MFALQRNAIYGVSTSKIIGADLRNANLSSTNLNRTNLISTNFTNANLTNANLENEFVGNIRWDQNTNWEGVRGLETAKNLPEALKQQLGLDITPKEDEN